MTTFVRRVSDATTQGNWRASELELRDAWVDPGPSPAGNPGPYLKAQPTRAAMRRKQWPESDYGFLTDRLYPRWFPGDRMHVGGKYWRVERVEFARTKRSWSMLIDVLPWRRRSVP